MELAIGDLIRTNSWFGVIVDIDDPHFRPYPYRVYFFSPDTRDPIVWLSEGEVTKYKTNVLQLSNS